MQDAHEDEYSTYRLRDPRSGDIKYIGITNDVKRRLRDHTHQLNKLSNSRKVSWIRELRQEGLTPILEPIDRHLTKSEARRRERTLIYLYRLDGIDLLNNEFAWMRRESTHMLNLYAKSTYFR